MPRIGFTIPPDRSMRMRPARPAEKPSRSGTGFATIADQQNVQSGRNT